MLNNSILKIFFIIFLFTFGFQNSIRGDQEIEWGSSRIAKSYKLEIREYKTKKLKIDTKVKTTKYRVNKLDPGLYEYRIGIINDKDAIVIYSDWTALSILQSFEPEGSIDEVYYGGKADQYQEIFITGNNFLEDTKIEVFSPQGNIPLKSYARISEKELKFTLDVRYAKERSYDLKIINPLNKIFVKKNFYVLGKTRREAEKNLEDAIKVSQGDNSGSDRKYFYSSILIPGWGQFKSGKNNDITFRKIRGGFFFLSFIGTGMYLTAQYRQYTDLVKKTDELNLLNTVVNYPFNPPLSLTGLFISNEYDSNSSAVSKKWHSISNLSYALVGIYIFNLIDAYFFTGDVKNLTNGFESTRKFQFNAFVLPDRNLGSQIGQYYAVEYKFQF